MNIFKVIMQRTMLVNFLLGFSSGLPLLLTLKTLQGWLADEMVGLTAIGLVSVVTIPYTLKFLWSPIFDRFSLPFLGRRRGWLFTLQLGLAAAILFLAFTSPNGALPLSERAPESITNFFAWLNKELPNNHLSFTFIGACFLVAFMSASQDIVVDAFRRESLKDEELGLGSTIYIYGYRVAMWVSGGLAFMLADTLSWPTVYACMAGFMVVGLVATIIAKEPELRHAPPRTLDETLIQPFKEFFSRTSVANAFAILTFILLYKVGDTMAGAMATPFYKAIGFSNAEIGAIAKTFGFFSSLVGGLIGGTMILQYGISRSLIFCGFLQAASTACFAILANMGNSLWGLTWVIAFEDVSSAMGTAAFTAYMASQTNTKFTATQYALLTSLMGVPRVFIAAPTGIWAEQMGWNGFFLFCTFAAIPGMLLLGYLLRRERKLNLR